MVVSSQRREERGKARPETSTSRKQKKVDEGEEWRDVVISEEK